MKIGFDLDGVFCTDSDTWLDKIMFKYIPNVWARFRQRFKKMIWKPEGFDYVIVTGSPFWDATVTRNWLKKNGVNVRVYYAPPMDEFLLPHLIEMVLVGIDDLNNSSFFSRTVLHKTKKILDLKLDMFIESDRNQAEMIANVLNAVRDLEEEEEKLK